MRGLRPAAHRGADHGFGLPGSVPRHRRPVVASTGATRLRLVPRPERSRAGALRPPEWRLPRWVAPGPEQRKPGSGIHPGLSPVAGGNAADTKHRAWRSTRNGSLDCAMKQIDVKRSTVTLDPDRTHVLARPFRLMSDQRSIKISARVMALPEGEVHTLLEGVRAEFGDRQLKIDEFLLRRFDDVSPYLLNGHQNLSEERKLLLAGYFTHEYSLEAAALFNPSMVPHPDQSNVPPGSLRFILSLRATAEGHVSSIAFRSGILDANSNITMDLPSRYSLEPMQVPNSTFEKQLFERKLQELRLMGDFNREVLNGLPDAFTMEELHASIGRATNQLPKLEQETTKGTARETLMLARSNYEEQFTPESDLSSRIFFPVTPSQSNGIEDARFVLFHNEDGTRTYYATYTAYDGKMILPQFLETSDFLRFKFITLNGPAVENKGMALFPRKSRAS